MTTKRLTKQQWLLGCLFPAACIAFIVIVALTPKKSAPPASEPEPDRDVAMVTPPLELGEGDSRAGTADLTSYEGRSATALPYGTRIERLESKIDAPAGKGRVRVTSGPRSGMIGWVELTKLQAAR